MGFYGLITLLLAMASTDFAEPSQSDHLNQDVEKVIAVVRDQRAGETERDRAFSALERLAFERAVELAPALLSEKGDGIRFRAAWVLASAGKAEGFQALRTMAEDRSGTLTLSIVALGRLRDEGSHQRLRELLEVEISDENKLRARPRTATLIDALSDYHDPADATLLARAVERFMAGNADWIDIDRLGRTGGIDAIPVLEDVFTARGKGWSVIAAGLGLARCGSPKGKRYVSERIADSRCCRAPYGTPQDGLKDDPYGPKATSFILDHLGVPADDGVVPDLIRLVSSDDYSEAAKAQGWIALQRIDSPKHQKEVLELAWRHLSYDGAARLIALKDQANALAKIHEPESASAKNATARGTSALVRALQAPERDKRLWKESKGYGF